ncbi:MAG: DUF4124 domain-containing protein [Burkholderiales bacterium]
MRAILLFALVLACGQATAQIYRWTDAQGRIHFSNTTPPPGVKATIVDPSSKEAPPGPESQECYTIRCQGERMEQRQARRDELEARLAAERAAAAPRPHKGLEFRKYVSIQRGMSEGELLGISGEPDLVADQGIAIAAPTTVQLSPNVRGPARSGLRMKTYTYLPTPADPFTTTITLVGGRVSEVARARKF